MRKEILPIFLIVLVDLLGLSIIIPLLPFYAKHFGATATQAGLLASSFAVCQLVASPVLGALSDRFGRKPVLLLSQIGTMLSLVMMALSTSLPMLFLSRVLAGATAANISVAQAYVADVTEAKERTKAFGIIGVAFGLGLFVGPALSSLFAQVSINAPIWLASGISAVSICVTLLILPNRTRGDQGQHASAAKRTISPWRFFSRPRTGFYLLQFFVFVFGFSFFVQGMGLFLQAKMPHAAGSDFGAVELGYLYSYCGLLGIVFQGWLVGRLAPRFGEQRLVLLSFLLGAVGFASFGWVSGWTYLIAASTVFSFANSFLRPCLTSLVSQTGSADEQGEILGVTATLQSMGQVSAPLLGGLLIDHGDLVAWPLALGGFYLLGAVISGPRLFGKGT
ncbi:MAG: MFS transporter [Bdellovibrionaceae bacterium]|nr:MFS transporter [Pseudobdellovibrionaceae bacterium]